MGQGEINSFGKQNQKALYAKTGEEIEKWR